MYFLRVTGRMELIYTQRRNIFKPYSTICRKGSIYVNGRMVKYICRQFFVSCYQKCIAELPCPDSLIIGSASSQKKIIPQSIKMDKEGRITANGQLLGCLETEQIEINLKKFNINKLKVELLDKYNILISKDNECLMFPLYDCMGQILAMQYIHPYGSYIDHFGEVFPSNHYPALYGWTPDFLLHDLLVITSNPLDAVAVNQEANVAAVSFPFRCSHFPTQLFSLLKQFQRIILWFTELRNWKALRPFAQMLSEKTFIISSKQHSPPLASLNDGSNIQHILKDAQPLKHQGVETCSDYRDSTYDLFKNHNKYCGLKWRRYTPLNEILKGHRPGELTIFSGQTGTGKTTFMSEYSLDLCMQGLYTLWGSFEVPNQRLLGTMLTQFSSYSLRNNLEKFDHVFSKFEDLPMFFIKFNADSTLDYIVDAMTFLVEYIGVQHIVIDNLQFMLNSELLNSFVDYWHRQDRIYSVFRRFSILHNCHITLIIHPRKEPEFSELHNTSISGNAKAIQEADNILILQTTKTKQYLEVTKNRFDGDKGCILLEFNKDSLTYHMKRAFKNP